MKRALWVFVCFLSLAAYADSVSDLAAVSAPTLIDLGVRMALAEWDDRLPEIIASAPIAPSNSQWKPGDPHFDAARKDVLQQFSGWADDLAKSPQAVEIVSSEFAKWIKAPQASFMAKQLATPALQTYNLLSDRKAAMVAFALAHSELQVGKPEFNSAFNAYAARLNLAPVEQTPELLALMQTPEGRAYDDARQFAVKTFQSKLLGQFNLLLYDRQQAVLRAIGPHAEKCGRAHRQGR